MVGRTKWTMAAALMVVGLAGRVERAAAQGGGVMEFASDDGGEGSHMAFFATGPDIFKLRRPDFVRTDVEVMREKLRLDTMQEQMIRTMVEEYLASFKTLIAEKLPKGPHGMMFVESGDDAAFGDDEPNFGGFQELVEGDGGDSEVMVVMGMNMETTVDGAEAGWEGAPNVGVQVQVAGPDGKDLSPEERAKLEAEAKRIAEEMKAKLEKQIAEQQAAGGGQFAPRSPEQMQAEMDEFSKQAEAFNREKARLRAQFVQDAQARIAPGQVDLWPGLERALLRKKTLSDGRLSGESTDLFKVVQQSQLTGPEATAVDARLAEYDVQLNDALVRRNQAVEDAERKINQAMRTSEMDKAISIADRASTSREALRDVNIRFAGEISGLLSAQAKADFEKAVRMAFHRRIYGKTRAQRAFEQSAKLEGLAEDQRTQMAQMSAAYESELAVLNEEIRQVTLAHEGEEIRKPFESMKKVMEEGPQAEHEHHITGEAEAIEKAYAKRAALDERTMRTLYGLFTTEQVATLPKIPSRKPEDNRPRVIYQSGDVIAAPGRSEPQ